MRIIKPLVIECNECNEIIEIDTDMECVYYEERSMGPECEYQGIVEDFCPKCGNDICVKICAWEYPEGAVNYCETEVDGAIVIQEPQLSCFE